MIEEKLFVKLGKQFSQLPASYSGLTDSELIALSHATTPVFFSMFGLLEEHLN